MAFVTLHDRFREAYYNMAQQAGCLARRAEGWVDGETATRSQASGPRSERVRPISRFAHVAHLLKSLSARSRLLGFSDGAGEKIVNGP